MQTPKLNLVRDKAYLKHVQGLPCVITGMSGDHVDPAHIRWNLGGGMGLKPSDARTVALSHSLHMEQHATSEMGFWLKYMPENPAFLMECLIAYAEKQHRLWSEE